MNKTVVIVGALLLIAFGAIVAFRFSGSGGSLTWGDTNVKCLPNGHQNLAQHYHPILSITVDGEKEGVPSNVGVSTACLSEAHTHDSTGVLHFESADANATFTVADFFAVWGESLEREGYTLTATINGEEVADVSTTVLSDGDQVALNYTSI